MVIVLTVNAAFKKQPISCQAVLFSGKLADLAINMRKQANATELRSTTDKSAFVSYESSLIVQLLESCWELGY